MPYIARTRQVKRPWLDRIFSLTPFTPTYTEEYWAYEPPLCASEWPDEYNSPAPLKAPARATRRHSPVHIQPAADRPKPIFADTEPMSSSTATQVVLAGVLLNASESRRPFESGLGGDFAGAGASGTYDTPEPSPAPAYEAAPSYSAPEPSPAPAPSDYGSSSSSSSDSGSSSSSSSDW